MDAVSGQHSGRSLSICVFGGARPGVAAGAEGLAARTGALLAERGHSLVYGAGGIGVMGAVARAAFTGGARVTGVIPQFLHERERAQAAPVSELVITDDLLERKRIMVDRSDAFLALPGGFGTLDEVLEIISLIYLGQTDKPMALVDDNGLWDGFMNLLTDLSRRGFADLPATDQMSVFRSAVDAVAFIEANAARPLAVEV